MAKVLYCKDVSFDCGFVARAASKEELLQQAARHAEEAHGIDELPAEVVEQVQASTSPACRARAAAWARATCRACPPS